MNEVGFDAGIPPGISLMFIKEKEVAWEAIEKMLEETKDKTIFTLIVRGLQKADSLRGE